MFHTVAERGLRSEYPVAWQIGIGSKARTYAVQVGSYLLESPMTWYKSSGWGLSPGYESMPLLDFERPVTQNCLFCHAGNARFTDSDTRRIQEGSVAPITCERCHGDAREHSARPSARNIVNPAKLKGPLRDSVCEQCHLEGETRVTNPGKTLDDFHAGDLLEKTIVTYILNGQAEEKRVVSQAEELAESKCLRASGGALWCGSCHDPHGAPVNRIAEGRAVCSGCHPALSKGAHAAKEQNCITCHMPARPANEVAHVSLTDHRIRRPGHEELPTAGGLATVKAWREPPPEFRERDRALAGLQVYAAHPIPTILTDSMKLLDRIPEAQQNNDPDMLAALEVLFLESSTSKKAVALAQWAVEAVPQSATFAMNYGLALRRAARLPEAERQLLRAVDLDPSLLRAWAELALLYDSQGKKQESMAIIARALKWNPQSIQFRLARRP